MWLRARATNVIGGSHWPRPDNDPTHNGHWTKPLRGRPERPSVRRTSGLSPILPSDLHRGIRSGANAWNEPGLRSGVFYDPASTTHAQDMQMRNLSPHTQRASIEHVARFARHFGRSPDALGPDQIRTYQIFLTNEKQLAPSSIVITVAALRFVYKVTLRKG